MTEALGPADRSSPIDLANSAEIDLARVALGSRAAFPTLEAQAYLAHCAISPPSSFVEAAVVAAMARSSRLGVGALAIALEVRERLRHRIAALVGASPGTVGIVANTSAGVSSIALNFQWRDGDGVIYFEGEFPTNVTPWQQAARLFSLRLFPHRVADFARDRQHALDELERRLTSQRVRLVAVSAVQFNTGLRMPVAEIAQLCHRHGALCFVDGIQMIGSGPFDLVQQDVDFASFGSHKWLMGTEGLGLLYVASGRETLLTPRTAGWLSHENPIDFLLAPGHLRYDKPIRSGADFVEAGAPNFLGIHALDASAAALQLLGLESIHQHIQRYLDVLEPRLIEHGWRSHRAADASGRSAILAATPPPGIAPDLVVRGFANAGIVVSTPDGYTRFAPHWPSSLDEVERVDDALKGISRGRTYEARAGSH